MLKWIFGSQKEDKQKIEPENKIQNQESDKLLAARKAADDLYFSSTSILEKKYTDCWVSSNYYGKGHCFSIRRRGVLWQLLLENASTEVLAQNSETAVWPAYNRQAEGFRVVCSIGEIVDLAEKMLPPINKYPKKLLGRQIDPGDKIKLPSGKRLIALHPRESYEGDAPWFYDLDTGVCHQDWMSYENDSSNANNVDSVHANGEYECLNHILDIENAVNSIPTPSLVTDQDKLKQSLEWSENLHDKIARIQRKLEAKIRYLDRELPRLSCEDIPQDQSDLSDLLAKCGGVPSAVASARSFLGVIQAEAKDKVEVEFIEADELGRVFLGLSFGEEDSSEFDIRFSPTDYMWPAVDVRWSYIDSDDQIVDGVFTSARSLLDFVLSQI